MDGRTDDARRQCRRRRRRRGDDGRGVARHEHRGLVRRRGHGQARRRRRFAGRRQRQPRLVLRGVRGQALERRPARAYDSLRVRNGLRRRLDQVPDRDASTRCRGGSTLVSNLDCSSGNRREGRAGRGRWLRPLGRGRERCSAPARRPALRRTSRPTRGLAARVGPAAAGGLTPTGWAGPTGCITVASGRRPAQAGTRRAPKAVPAIRSRRVIPDLARSDVRTGIGGEPAGDTAAGGRIKRKSGRFNGN